MESTNRILFPREWPHGGSFLSAEHAPVEDTLVKAAALAWKRFITPTCAGCCGFLLGVMCRKNNIDAGVSPSSLIPHRLFVCAIL